VLLRLLHKEALQITPSSFIIIIITTAPLPAILSLLTTIVLCCHCSMSGAFFHRCCCCWCPPYYSQGLEEASRLYFGESNVEGMLGVLLPLHDMMERHGPTTLKEIAFVQTYGR
jgi:hypothetical protein